MGPGAILASLAILAPPMVLAQGPKGGSSPTTPPLAVDLTGYWRLAPDLSDGPRPEGPGALRGLQSDADPRRPPVFDPGPGGIPWDPEGWIPTGPGIDIMTPGVAGTDRTGDPLGWNGTSRSSSSLGRAPSDYVRDLPETLTITQRASLILIQEDDDEGRTRALHPDGVRRRAANGQSEDRSLWENGRLHVETWHDDGLHVKEIFDLAPDRTLLSVSLQIEGGDRIVALERVFRPDRSAAH